MAIPRIMTTITIPLPVYERLERARGHNPRGPYIARLIVEALDHMDTEQNTEQELILPPRKVASNR